MVKRKVSSTAASFGRRSKRSKTSNDLEGFVWKPKDWIWKKKFSSEVSVLVNKTSSEQLVVKKVLEVHANSASDPRPTEIRTLAMLPDCNRVVKPLFYSHSDPAAGQATAIYEFFFLGDLQDYKEQRFDKRNHKAVPESHIWRFFVQMSQALAFIQNHIGPGRDERHCLLHRDIKPHNILVVDNGTTYPSFKLHDFGVAMVYQRSKARRSSFAGTYEWQPPENPVINTTKADVWALGACVHYLAVGQAPLQNIAQYTISRYKEFNQHPHSAQSYHPLGRYYAARVPRSVTPINLSEQEQRIQGIAPYAGLHRAPFNHQYSDELNDWMTRCLSRTVSRRPTSKRIISDMIPLARQMLTLMGGKAALIDLDVKYGMDE